MGGQTAQTAAAWLRRVAVTQAVGALVHRLVCTPLRRQKARATVRGVRPSFCTCCPSAARHIRLYVLAGGAPRGAPHHPRKRRHLPPARRQRRSAASPRAALATFRARTHFRTVPEASALAARAAFCSAFFALGLLPAFSCAVGVSAGRLAHTPAARSGLRKPFPRAGDACECARERPGARIISGTRLLLRQLRLAAGGERLGCERAQMCSANGVNKPASQMRSAAPRTRTLLLVVGLGRHGVDGRVQERRGMARLLHRARYLVVVAAPHSSAACYCIHSPALTRARAVQVRERRRSQRTQADARNASFS